MALMSQLLMPAPPASRYTGSRSVGGPTHGSQSRTITLHREDAVTADITSLLASAEQGDRAAADAVFSLLYNELHRMARRELGRRGSGVTLGATTLLHDAYLDISGRQGTAFPDRNRFMGYAARVMRNIIIDYARRHQAQKRGGLFEITSLRTGVDVVADAAELTSISEALDELATLDERLARIVDLKFFCGFSFLEIAGMMNLSERTVQRDWEKARIYLHQRLRADLGAS
jgi:RNA polymerase sigma factor (TIGR02999 family)